MRLYITRRPNGQHLLTALKPVITRLGRSDTEDVFAKPGDPISYNNICGFFVKEIWGLELQPFESRRVNLTGEVL